MKNTKNKKTSGMLTRIKWGGSPCLGLSDTRALWCRTGSARKCKGDLVAISREWRIAELFAPEQRFLGFRQGIGSVCRRSHTLAFATLLQQFSTGLHGAFPMLEEKPGQKLSFLEPDATDSPDSEIHSVNCSLNFLNY